MRLHPAGAVFFRSRSARTGEIHTEKGHNQHNGDDLDKHDQALFQIETGIFRQSFRPAGSAIAPALPGDDRSRAMGDLAVRLGNHRPVSKSNEKPMLDDAYQRFDLTPEAFRDRRSVRFRSQK